MYYKPRHSQQSAKKSRKIVKLVLVVVFLFILVRVILGVIGTFHREEDIFVEEPTTVYAPTESVEQETRSISPTEDTSTSVAEHTDFDKSVLSIVWESEITSVADLIDVEGATWTSVREGVTYGEYFTEVPADGYIYNVYDAVDNSGDYMLEVAYLTEGDVLTVLVYRVTPELRIYSLYGFSAVNDEGFPISATIDGKLGSNDYLISQGIPATDEWRYVMLMELQNMILKGAAPEYFY